MIKIRLLLRVVLLLATGIWEALRSANNLKELEERIQRLTQEATVTLLAAALEEIDRVLCAQRDVKRYENVGLRSRVLVTSVGEVRFRRWLYRDLEKGEACFLLDQVLGLGRNEPLARACWNWLWSWERRCPFGGQATSWGTLCLPSAR